MERLLPYLGIGVLFVFLVVGLVFISYLLVWGAVLGILLYCGAWLKNRFFPQKDLVQPGHVPYQSGGSKPGRTFENE